MDKKHSDSSESSDNSNNEQSSYDYDSPETADQPDEPAELIVNNADIHAEVPLVQTYNTESAPSEPLDQEKNSTGLELKNTKDLQDFITNPWNKVEVFPLLLTVTGFPKSGKTTAITQAFELPKGTEKQTFAHHELMASGVPVTRKIKSFAAIRDRSFKFGVQAGLIKESAKVSFDEPNENDQRSFRDIHLQSHLLLMARHIQERQKLSLQTKKKRKKNKNKTRQLECELKHGIRLVNLWDVSINESIRPFLETISCCFTRNRMWLFIDLDEDVEQLEIPLKTKDDTKLKMQWRSRMQYLLRMCQMCKHTTASTKDGYKKFCTVFAIHKNPLNASTVSTLIQNLKDELENAAKQMGVENILNLEIKTACLDELNTRMFRKTMKTTLHHIEKQEIPLSWLFLRGSFIDHPKYYITLNEFETKAQECNIKPNALTEFCDFFTSFGSIFDIRRICKDSKYIVVKPFAFLSRLQKLYGEKVQRGLISTPKNGEQKVLMEILASVGITWFMEGPNKYYFPSLSDTGKIERQNIPWALQLVVSLQAPKMNLDVELPQKIHEKLSLCKETTYRAQFELTEYTNSVAITIQNDITAKLMITFQGDITEITFENEFIKKTQEDKDAQMHIKKLCIEIIKAIQEMFQEKSESIRYNFAIICKADSHSKINVAFNAYRKRHILPKYSLCEKCTEDTLYLQNRHIIKAWSTALENNPIPDEMKLQGDFSLGDAETLATEISKYPWIAIDMFAKKLRAKTYLIEPKKKQEWVVMGMIMEWEGRRRDDDESSKKAMAGMLMELHQEWKTEREKLPDGTQVIKWPEFNNLARQFDFQALTKKQMEDIQRQLEEREKDVEAAYRRSLQIK